MPHARTNRTRRLGSLGILLAMVWLSPQAGARAEEVDYLKHVKPLLAERCLACHGALKQEAGLRLDTAAALRQGGDDGPILTPGRLTESRLLERLTSQDESLRMPPPGEGAMLSQEQVDRIARWIAAGAIGPADEAPERDPREHWAFQPIRRPIVPTDTGAEHPIDALLSAAQRGLNVEPLPLAERAVLLRRLSLDLIGLPPTAEELAEFLQDDQPGAYERQVERLLASPHYGERWARHWMDVWRYSDWYGRRQVPDVWNSAPQVWRWRDWLVRSLNEDRGYDRLLQEMLAGDELAPGDEQTLVATGYLVRNWYALNPNQWMRDIVEHTGKAFLGLTFNCAHCHNHKYDPITQEDYFRFRAFFEPLGVRQDRWPGEGDPGPYQKYEYVVLRKIQRLGSVGVFDEHPDAPTRMYAGGDERSLLADRPPVTPGMPAILRAPLTIAPIDLPVAAWYPGSKPFVREAVRLEAQQAVAAAEQAVAAAQSRRDAERPRRAADREAAQAAIAAWQATQPAGANDAPLSGKQSLLLSAPEGRRALGYQPRLPALAAGDTLSFELAIVADAHVNFQLAKSVPGGLTAGYLGFEAGQITSYQPASVQPFVLGSYSHAAGERRFRVVWRLDPLQDQALLTVECLSNGKTLASEVPVALGGWNPHDKPEQGFFLDCRTGTIAAFDQLQIHRGEQSLLLIDFESPAFAAGNDVLPAAGWTAGFSAPPATSRVSVWLQPTAQSQPLEQALGRAARLEAALDLEVAAAEAKRSAARLDVERAAARIAADDARLTESPEKTERLAVASRLERQYEHALAVARVAEAASALAAAEGLPLDDTNRAAAISKAQGAWNAAQAALVVAEQGLADDKRPPAPLSTLYPQSSTGRRAALARWMTDRENPLPARVAVNHVWRWHFGQPLAPTVADFGRNGKPPEHPELIDWLAAELLDHRWSLKHLHRQIVTSQAYRRRAAVATDQTLLAADPTNHSYARFVPHRLEAEVIRDALLATSDALDRTLGGPSLERLQEDQTNRRSLYYEVFPEDGGHLKFLSMFDPPDPCDAYRRSETVVPQQALALTNSRLVLQHSRALAAQLKDKTGPAAPDEAFVDAAFRQLFSRSPTADEHRRCVMFLDQQRQRFSQDKSPPPAVTGLTAPAVDPAQRARESLLRVLYNHDDFVTLR